MMYEGKGISVHVDGHTLLEGVDIEIHPGRITALLGPNGAGKTTLLRVLIGDLSPGSGDVLLDGDSLRSWPPARQARVRAVVPQSPSLSFGFSVRDTVQLGRIPHDYHPQQSMFIDRALDLMGLRAKERQPYPTLSGGERQRVHLARALVQIWEPTAAHARFLFLDEPTASQDARNAVEIMKVLKAWASAGVGVLAVLHDVNLAAQWADQLVVLRNGQKIADGPVLEVICPEVIEQAFGIKAEIIHNPNGGRPVLLPPNATLEAS